MDSNTTALATPEEFAEALVFSKGPTITRSNGDVINCPSILTPGSNSASTETKFSGEFWKCPAGSFCQCPTCEERCPAGFYCPANTFQPLYCCPGFYCPDPSSIAACPEGSFCPVGTVNPVHCTKYWSTCEAGSDKPVRVMYFIPLTLPIVLVSLIFTIKTVNWRLKLRSGRRLLRSVRGSQTAENGYWKAINESESDDEACNYELGNFSLSLSFALDQSGFANGTAADRLEVGQGTWLSADNRGVAVDLGNTLKAVPEAGTPAVASTATMVNGFSSPLRSMHGREQENSVMAEELRKTKQDVELSQSQPPIGDGAAHAMNTKMLNAPRCDPAAQDLSSLTVEFKNLCFRLPSGIKAMQGVTGNMQPGRVLAIMGPSGAGKTTFFSLLTGKLLLTSGNIIVNGEYHTLQPFKKLVGYVPQDDIMLRDIPVYDLLLHSARLRLPASWCERERRQRVLEVVEFLGLSGVMYQKVGDERHRGISGGQRKRVNIGMELVANPQVLLLDEPTSGLDSSTAFEVANLFRRIAEENSMTVAAIIHSPSASTFRQFHDLLLLSTSGQVVYHGPRKGARAYFAQLGFVCPPTQSIPDFIMDVVAGKVPLSWNPDFTVVDLIAYWEKWKKGEQITVHDSRKVYEDMVYRDAKTRKKESQKIGWLKLWWISLVWRWRESVDWVRDLFAELFSFIAAIFVKERIRKTPNALLVFWYCVKRTLLQLSCNPAKFMIHLFVHAFVGFFISLVVSQVEYLGQLPYSICRLSPAALREVCFHPIDALQRIGVLMSLGVLFSGIMASSTTFGPELPIFWRDSRSGMLALSYFAAKLSVDLVRMTIGSLMCGLGISVAWGYRSTFVQIWGMLWMLYAVAWAVGYVLSIFFPPDSVSLLGTFVSILFGLVLSGSVPSLSVIMNPKSSYYPIRILWELSPTRYFVENIYLLETAGRDWEELQGDKLRHTYNRHNWKPNIIRMGIMIVCSFTLAFTALKLRGRNHQK